LGTQSAAFSVGVLDTLTATQGPSDEHRSQHARPPRNRQSPSNAQAEYSGTLRTSKASQREFTQRAAMLGLSMVGHLGQGIGTGHVSALKTATCAALTPANASTSGIPQGPQQPLSTATHAPGPAHAPQSTPPSPVPESPVPDPPVPDPPAPEPPPSNPPVPAPPVPGPPPEPPVPVPPTPEAPPVAELPPDPEAPPVPDDPPAPEMPPAPEVPPAAVPPAPPPPAPPVLDPLAPPLPPELPPAPLVPPPPATPPVAPVPASTFVPAAPDAAALPPSGSPGLKVVPPHPTARPSAAITR
jgi:hypothetical protein